MMMIMKAKLARVMIRAQLRRFAEDSHPFNRLCGRAALLQTGRISDETFRRDLDRFYAGLDPLDCAHDVELAEKRAALASPGGYKVDVLSLASDRPDSGPAAGPFWWRRRFGLLRRLGIRSDVLVLGSGDQIPPHGHSQVVSGFYVLEGEVGVRHYDRAEDHADHVMLRKVVDTNMGPGGYTTNSEFHHNVHWLVGRAPRSYLFRFTVTDVPVERFNAPGHKHDRDYVNPTASPDSSGLIPAPYITEAEARALAFD